MLSLRDQGTQVLFASEPAVPTAGHEPVCSIQYGARQHPSDCTQQGVRATQTPTNRKGSEAFDMYATIRFDHNDAVGKLRQRCEGLFGGIALKGGIAKPETVGVSSEQKLHRSMAQTARPVVENRDERGRRVHAHSLTSMPQNACVFRTRRDKLRQQRC